MSEAFNEDHALAFLHRPDLTGEMLAVLSRNPEAMKSRKVLLALIAHPRTPRHVSVPLLRRVFTFDLMQIALTPAVAADVKKAAEGQILLRLETLSTGEKVTLAKRASGRVAAALLHDPDARVVAPALDNAQLTEALVVEALMRPHAPAILFELLSEHRNWRMRREVQIALLRSENTPLERAREFVKNGPGEFLREILPESRRDTLTANSSATPYSPLTENAEPGDPK